MAFQHGLPAEAHGVPDVDLEVGAGSREALAVRTPGQPAHTGRMPDHPLLPVGLDIPDLHRPALNAREGEALAVGVEADGVGGRPGGEAFELLAGGRLMKANRTAPRLTHGEPATVWTEVQADVVYSPWQAQRLR